MNLSRIKGRTESLPRGEAKPFFCRKKSEGDWSEADA